MQLVDACDFPWPTFFIIATQQKKI